MTDRTERLVNLWRTGELVEFAYEVTVLYSLRDYRLISETMDEVKRKINEIN